jgi:hypothetical protein
LCAPEIRCTPTSGQASASHTARSGRTPPRRASTGNATAASARPSTATIRNTTMAPVSDPVSRTAAPEIMMNNGPYGAGVSRQTGDTDSSQGQGRAATPWS